MSLLLNALKEADGRHNRPTGASASAPAQVSATGTVRAPAAAESQVLSILEDAVPAAAVSPAAQESNPAAPARAGEDRLARRRERRAVGVKGQNRNKQLVVLALLFVVAGLGAAWLLLPGTADQPALVSRSLPAPTAPVEPAVPVAPPAVSPPQNAVIPPPRLEAAAPVAAPPVRVPAPKPRATPAVEKPAVVSQQPLVVTRIARSALQEGYIALRAGDLKLAETRYLEVLRDAPHQTDALLGLAALAQARGDDTTALHRYIAVLDAVPDHPRAWSGVADLAGTGEFAAMESRLRGLLAARPAASLYFALGNLLGRQTRWPEAQESYFNAVTAAPANADYAFNLGVALDHLGKRGAAMSYYGRALELARDGRPVQFDASSASARLALLQGAGP